MLRRLLGKIMDSALHSKRPRRYYGSSSGRRHRPGPMRHSSSHRYQQHRSYGSGYYKKKGYSSS
ncbi:hypothetical protein SAMN02799630_04004 [Paenibacillus sp. UNCCL117]|uniref:hypothetical protein n=1 Tax=unclassified Paenibacillus TaxID=185978 RepID=UPI0008925A78|nr:MULTISPECIES: hypothetical protein [unclassified Paenibacillus]SDD77512.1 hypothetical protein SAMN04488602_11369 [Paenibacillus sp. cl123]SFW52744.1 hypothetical protein SAMN02799630_04004 [Paenibacillus sp. UNCCL117]